MARTIKIRHYTPIGVEFRDAGVYATQFRVANGAVALHVAAAAPYQTHDNTATEGQSAVAALKSVLAQHSFVGSRVVGTIPNAEVDIRSIVLPEGVEPDDEQRIKNAIWMEAQSLLLYSPQDAVLDYLPLVSDQDNSHGRHRVLLVATRKESANRILQLCKAAGAKCVHLEAGPCATARVLGANQKLVAVVSLDQGRTDISIVRDSTLLFSRTIKIGYQILLDELVSALQLEEHQAEHLLRNHGFTDRGAGYYSLDEVSASGQLRKENFPAMLYEICCSAFEKLASEVKRSVDYFSIQQQGGAVEMIYVVGSLLPMRIEALLEERLGIPVEIGDPFKGIEDVTNIPDTDVPAFTVAAGLALRDEVS